MQTRQERLAAESLAAFRRPQTLQTQPLASRSASNSSIDLRSRRRRMPGSHSVDKGRPHGGYGGQLLPRRRLVGGPVGDARELPLPPLDQQDDVVVPRLARAAATGVMPCLFAFSKSQGDSSSKTLIIAASPARAAAQNGDASNACGHTKS